MCRQTLLKGKTLEWESNKQTILHWGIEMFKDEQRSISSDVKTRDTKLSVSQFSGFLSSTSSRLVSRTRSPGF